MTTSWSISEWFDDHLGRQIGLAALASLVAFAARFAVDPFLGDEHEFLPAYVAIALVAWLASWRAALLVAVLAQMQMQHFQPRSALDFVPSHLWMAIVSYFVISGAIIYLACRVSQIGRSLRNIALELEQSDLRKSDFLALTAHELRNPLASIAAGEKLIMEGNLTDTVLQRTVRAMERQTSNMKHLIEDLLDLARIEQDKIVLSREVVHVTRLVEDAIADVKTFVDAKCQRVVHRTGGDPGFVNADRFRINQVLTNLLHNASKFSPAESTIEVNVAAPGGHVSISVKDAGVGIPAAELQKIFVSFVQLQPNEGKPQGLGLGLALSRKLVQLHGGSIEARSEGPGRGAEFIVTFPLAPRDMVDLAMRGHPDAPTVNSIESRPEQALRLLVVDDNDDAAETLAMLLRIMGHHATTASDGNSALRAADEEQPDFIFLDIGLPDMTGHQVATKLRQTAGRQPVLVALSGWGTEEDRQRSRDAGFDNHLTKPVTAEDIQLTLARCARR